ncbi:MAG: hypothetical protein QXR81_07550 [Candidatus Nezhaarchaeales archaeon]
MQLQLLCLECDYEWWGLQDDFSKYRDPQCPKCGSRLVTPAIYFENLVSNLIVSGLSGEVRADILLLDFITAIQEVFDLPIPPTRKLLLIRKAIRRIQEVYEKGGPAKLQASS